MAPTKFETPKTSASWPVQLVQLNVMEDSQSEHEGCEEDVLASPSVKVLGWKEVHVHGDKPNVAIAPLLPS